MNDERDKHSMDDLVSATYREHSTEHAPEHLNQKILAMAADGSGKSKNIRPLFGKWTRPLTLVATFALSFAIVLEVTRVPQDVVAPATPVAPARHSIREELTPKVSATPEEARNQAPLQDGFNRDESLTADPQASIKLDTRQNTEVADAPTEALESEIIPQSAPEAAGFSDVDRPDRAKRSLNSDLEQAGEAVAEDATRPAATAFSMSVEKKESDATTSCEATDRESAEDWLACIEELRRSGADSEAGREYEAYILKFPAE